MAGARAIENKRFRLHLRLGKDRKNIVDAHLYLPYGINSPVEINISVVNINVRTANINSNFTRLEFHQAGKYGKIYVKDVKDVKDDGKDIQNFGKSTNTLEDCTIAIGGDVDHLLSGVTITYKPESGYVKLSIPTLSYTLEYDTMCSVCYTFLGWGSNIYKLKLTQPLEFLKKTASIKSGKTEPQQIDLQAQIHFPIVFITTVEQVDEMSKVQHSSNRAMHSEVAKRNRPAQRPEAERGSPRMAAVPPNFIQIFERIETRDKMKLEACTNMISMRIPSFPPIPQAAIQEKPPTQNVTHSLLESLQRAQRAQGKRLHDGIRLSIGVPVSEAPQ